MNTFLARAGSTCTCNSRVDSCHYHVGVCNLGGGHVPAPPPKICH